MWGGVSVPRAARDSPAQCPLLGQVPWKPLKAGNSAPATPLVFKLPHTLQKRLPALGPDAAALPGAREQPLLRDKNSVQLLHFAYSVLLGSDTSSEVRGGPAESIPVLSQGGSASSEGPSHRPGSVSCHCHQ